MTQSNTCKNTLTCNCTQCNTTQIYSHVPKPRLVGIELNPGPLNGPDVKKIQNIVKSEVGNVQSLVAQTGEMLGRAAAKGAKKKAKKPRKGNSSLGLRGTSGPGRSTPLNIQRNMPVAYGQILQSSVPNANVRIPFSTSALNVYASAAGPVSNPKIVSISTMLTSGLTFGQAVGQLASLYREYRITRLKCTFVPIKGTDTPGLIAFGFSPDPMITDPVSIDEVCSYKNNFTTSLYERVTVDLASMVGKNATETKYYIPSNFNTDPFAITTSANANGRLTSIGSLVSYCVGVNAAAEGEVLGTLRFEGEIELMDLAPQRSSVVPNLEVPIRQSLDERKEPETHPVLQRQVAQELPPPHSNQSSQMTSGFNTPNLLNQSQLAYR